MERKKGHSNQFNWFLEPKKALDGPKKYWPIRANRLGWRGGKVEEGKKRWDQQVGASGAPSDFSVRSPEELFLRSSVCVGCSALSRFHCSFSGLATGS